MMKFTLTFIAAILFLTGGLAQTQFWSDNFEDSGAPSSGTRTPSSDFSCTLAPSSTPTSYFTRAVPTSLNMAAGTYSGFQGSKAWVGEDIDQGVSCANGSQSVNQTITWSSINIAGKTGLSFQGLFAANGVTTNNWEGIGAGVNQDFVLVEYRIDGGSWTKAIAFYGEASTFSQYLSLDANGDLTGDATSRLGYAFANFSAPLTGTGTTLDLRFSASSNNSGTEEFAVDNFRLFETPSCTAPTIIANPPNRAVCAGNNTTFSASASGATTYQWQYDQTGGGTYTDVPNLAPYSGVTSNTLTITGVTSGMAGYRYRMVAINGVASCFTNSNFGTLNVSSINTSSMAQSNVSCHNGSNGVAAIMPTGGIAGYTYSWSPSGGTGQTATGLAQGTYTVTVTDGIGCQATQSFTITEPPTSVSGSAIVTNVACNGGTNGAIDLTPAGGTPGYTYSWGGGITTQDRINLAAGSYSVTITDANGCIGNVAATLTQPTAVSGSTIVTNVSCNGGTNGVIDLTPTGGTPGYTYSWGGGITTQDRISLAAGSYSVTITDANACTGTVAVTVTQPTAVSGSTVVTNVACNGGTNGAINLTPSGGTPGYTFDWGGGITTEDRTSLTAGTYSVTITDANACTGTVAVTVTQPTAVSGSTVVTNVACFGGTNGAINLTPSGGTPGYTYDWGGGITTQDRTSLAAGTYSVTITDANACTGTVAVTVTQPTAPVSGSTVVTNVACHGQTNGAINLTPTGGTPGYTFDWGGGITTEDRILLAAGTYSVTITDANGCPGVVTATVTEPTATVSGSTVVTNVACNGQTNGAINLTPTGGTPGYTFDWGGGITTEDRTGLAAGTYSVTITDANGCMGTVAATLTAPTAVSGSTVVTNVACFGGTNGAINLTPTGGTPGYTFDWGGGITTEDRTGLAAGTYSVDITDANGCTGTVAVTVTQPTAPVSGSTVVSNVACVGGSNGTINLTPTGGTPGYTFDWGGGITTEDRTGLVAGTYSVDITDANGCPGTVTATVTEPTAPVSGSTVVTEVSCFGGSNGIINLTPTGGTPGYTFDWGGGITTEDRTGLAAGTYSVNITDANGCPGTVIATVTEPTALVSGSTVVTDASCFGGSNGTINLTPTGGTPGYTFDWGGGITTEDRTGLAAGTYAVDITDANGCPGTVSATVGEPTAVSGSTVVVNTSCSTGTNGAINLTPTGGTPGYTFDWGGGITTEDRTSLAAGTYSVDITDANGCTGTVAATVTEPPALDLAPSQTDVACNGQSNGTAMVSVTGGTSNYTYSWSPSGGTGATASGLSASTYVVTVTDANGCVATHSFTITEPPVLVASAGSQTDISCNGLSDGSATVNVTGGTPNYTYSWSPSGGTSATASGLGAGTYTVTVTDINGCTDMQSFTITEPPVLAATVDSQTNVSCNGQSNGAATVAVTGGTPNYTYSWSPSGGTSATASGLGAGTYTVTVTDNNGCTAMQSFTITEPSAVNLTAASQTDLTCNGGNTGAASVNPATGGTGIFTYDWTPGTPTGDGTTSVTGLSAGTYMSTATDENGCTASVSFTITEPAAITGTTSATACDSYTLNGQTYMISGTYTQALTAANGCDSILTLNLTIKQSTTATMDVNACSDYTLNGQTYTSSGTYTQHLTNMAGCDSTITLNLTIGAPNSATLDETACSSYTLNGVTYVSSGTYSQVLTNASGCDSTLTLNLTITLPTDSTMTETACGSFDLNGETYATSGTYTQTLENAAGCDSTITLNLTILEPTDSTLTETACESFDLNGQTYMTSGTYTQTLENAAGCDSTITLNLTIHNNTSSTMTITACDSYTLNGETFNASGIFTQVLSNTNGCDSILTLNLSILETPVAGVTQTNAVTLQATGTGTSYQWIDCDNGNPIAGATTQSFTFTENGSYAVVISNGICDDTSACIVVDEVSLEEVAGFHAVIAPNPTNDVFTVTMTGISSADILVYDAQGKVVMTIPNAASGQVISLGNVQRGMYMIHVTTPQGSIVERLMKQ